MNFERLLERVGEGEARLDQVEVPARDITIRPGLILAENRRLELTPEGFSQVCQGVGAPASYVGRLGKKLGAAVLQHHIQKGDLEDRLKTELVTLYSNGDEFLTFGRPTLTRLTGREVLTCVGEGVPSVEDLEVHDARIEALGFQIDILGLSQEHEVRRGDVIRAGLRITHSLTEQHATTIEAFLFRLVCLNGLTHRECVSRKAARTRRLPADNPRAKELQQAQIRKLASDTWNALEEKLEAIGQLQDDSVDVERLFTTWLHRARISTRLLPSLRAAWEEEGSEPTSYAAMNAMTRLATHHSGLSDRQRREIAVLAGLFAFRRIHLCPRCFSLVRT